MMQVTSIGPGGIQTIKTFESLVPYTYDDAGPKLSSTGLPREYTEADLLAGIAVMGTLTIGYGHTGKHAVPGRRMDADEADVLLRSDLRDAERAVIQHVKVPLNQTQFSALCSFVFNVGEGAFARSTLLRLLNEGRYGAVPAQLARWDKTTINGQKVQSRGLARRRAREAELWATGETAAETVRAKPDAIEDRSASQTRTVRGAAMSAIGLAGTALSDAAAHIQPLSQHGDTFKYTFIALTVLGIGLTVWGRIRVMRDEGV